MWHRDVSFMQKNNNTELTIFSGNKTQERMIWVKCLQMKRWTGGCFGLTALFFSVCKSVWWWWTKQPEELCTELGPERERPGWGLVGRSFSGHWRVGPAVVLIEKERQQFRSFLFVFFSRKVSGSSETFSMEKKNLTSVVNTQNQAVCH